MRPKAEARAMERRVSGRAIRIAGRCEGARREKAGCVWVTYRSEEEMGGERVKQKERAEGMKSKVKPRKQPVKRG